MARLRPGASLERGTGRDPRRVRAPGARVPRHEPRGARRGRPARPRHDARRARLAAAAVGGGRRGARDRLPQRGQPADGARALAPCARWRSRTRSAPSRGRLVAGLLVESLLLAGVGGALGIGPRAGPARGTRGAGTCGNAADRRRPRSTGACSRSRSLLTLATGVLFGLLPALTATRSISAGVLQTGGREHSSRAVLRFRGALVTLQVALALVLLLGATLVVRSMVRLNAVALGFETERVVAARVNLPPAALPRRRAPARLLRGARAAARRRGPASRPWPSPTPCRCAAAGAPGSSSRVGPLRVRGAWTTPTHRR